jgi:hypothetical protein
LECLIVLQTGIYFPIEAHTALDLGLPLLSALMVAQMYE